MSCAATKVKKGSQPVVDVEFRAAPTPPALQGTLTDPTTVQVITQDPSGDQVTYTSPNAAITNPSTGVWRFTFPAAVTEVGRWWVKVSGTAGLIASSEVFVDISGSHLSP